MTNTNTIDDFDTQIHSDELYDGDTPCYECGGFTDNHRTDCPELPVPTMEADRDDHAIEADRDWNMYPHDLDGYEHPEFDS